MMIGTLNDVAIDKPRVDEQADLIEEVSHPAEPPVFSGLPILPLKLWTGRVGNSIFDRCHSLEVRIAALNRKKRQRCLQLVLPVQLTKLPKRECRGC